MFSNNLKDQFTTGIQLAFLQAAKGFEMTDIVQILRLDRASEARSTNRDNNRDVVTARDDSASKDFESALEKAKKQEKADSRTDANNESSKSDVQRENKPSTLNNDSKAKKSDEREENRESGLVVKQEKVNREPEGSSRSASLSPEKPVIAEDAQASQSSQLSLDEVGGSNLLDLGGEDPFLLDLLLSIGVGESKDKPIIQPNQEQVGAVQDQVIAQILSEESAKHDVQAAVGQLLQNLVPEQGAKAVPLPIDTQSLLAQEINKNPITDTLSAEEPVTEETEFKLPNDEKQAKAVQKQVEQLLEVEKPTTDLGQEIQKLLNKEAPKIDLHAASSKHEEIKGNQDKGKQNHQKAVHETLEIVNQLKFSSEAHQQQDSFTGSFEDAVYKRTNLEDIKKLIVDATANPKLENQNSEAFAKLMDKVSFAQKAENVNEAPATQASRNDSRLVPGSLEDHVLRQIRIQLTTKASNVDIRLFPPDLGAVRIQFRMEGDSMVAHIHATEKATGALLDKYMPELRSAMQDAGIEVREIQVASGHSLGGFEFAKSEHNQQGEGKRFSPKDNYFSEDEIFDDERVLLEKRYTLSRAAGGIDLVA